MILFQPDYSITYAGIQFVGGYSEGFNGGTSDRVISLTSLTGGLASQPSAGDIVIAVNTSQNALNAFVGDAKAITGYTSIMYQSARTPDINHETSIGRVSYKIMGSTPDTSLTIAGGTGDTSCAGSISLLVFRGVNQTTPIDTTLSYTLTASGTAKANPPSITASNNAMIVAGGTGAYHNGTATYTSSDLTGFITSLGSDDYNVISGIGYHLSTGVAFDPAQFGNAADASDYTCIGFTVALKAA